MMTTSISTLIDDKADKMLNDLQDVGFTPDQATGFLAETSNETLNVLRHRANSIEFRSATEMSLISMLMDNMDASSIGSRVGIDSQLADHGLQTILPSIVSTLANRTNISDLVAAMNTQRGLVDKIRGMFGNVIGR